MFGTLINGTRIGEDRKDPGNTDNITIAGAAKQKKYEYVYEYGINSHRLK